MRAGDSWRRSVLFSKLWPRQVQVGDWHLREAMKNYLRVLWIPLLVELANVAVHRILRASSSFETELDLISTIVTCVIVCIATWVVAKASHSWLAPILSGVLIW